MTIPAYDLEIHVSDVMPRLSSGGMVRIIGYERSGKTTLSEILARELGRSYRHVLLQNATTWLWARPAVDLTHADAQASIDPELPEAVARLERCDRSCWIVDDADIMLAYGSPGFLQSISRKVAERRFDLILIRNRFIQESAGWFREREAYLSPSIPRLIMKPLEGEAALSAARTLCHGLSAPAQVQWLVEMSGGIPGLMSDLSRYAEAAVTSGSTARVLRLAHEHGTRLRIADPQRQMIIKALAQLALPPPTMLTEGTQAQLAALMLAGMVHRDYAFRETPFCGRYWELVVGREATGVPIPTRLADKALRLEITMRASGLADQFCTALDLDSAREGDLAHMFALSLFCETHAPALARPLRQILAEVLGAFHLSDILRQRNIRVEKPANALSLAARLLEVEDAQ
jgi:hypothetical protein